MEILTAAQVDEIAADWDNLSSDARDLLDTARAYHLLRQSLLMQCDVMETINSKHLRGIIERLERR